MSLYSIAFAGESDGTNLTAVAPSVGSNNMGYVFNSGITMTSGTASTLTDNVYAGTSESFASADLRNTLVFRKFGSGSTPVRLLGRINTIDNLDIVRVTASDVILERIVGGAYDVVDTQSHGGLSTGVDITLVLEYTGNARVIKLNGSTIISQSYSSLSAAGESGFGFATNSGDVTNSFRVKSLDVEAMGGGGGSIAVISSGHHLRGTNR